MIAEGAFFHHAFGADSWQGVISFRVVIRNNSGAHLLGLFLWRARAPLDQCFVIAPELMGLAPVKVDHPIGTVKFTVLAADALVGIMHGDAVVQFVHGFCRTPPGAGGICAVIAKRGNIMIAHIGKRPPRFGDFVGPVDAVGHIVFVSASNAAGAAPNTSL